MAISGVNIVADLLPVPFSRRSFNEKMDIVKKGRPTPKHLELNQPAKAGYVRHIQADNWERYTWFTDTRDFTAGSACCLNVIGEWDWFFSAGFATVASRWTGCILFPYTCEMIVHKVTVYRTSDSLCVAVAVCVCSCVHNLNNAILRIEQ